MAEVKKNKTTKAKKSSKVLDKTTNLNNDELLEQILNKKKNKVQKSIAPRRKSTNVSKTIKVDKKKEEISSDELYEQIKAKKTSKKKKAEVKLELTEDKIEETVVEDVSENTAVDKIEVKDAEEAKNEDKVQDDLIITREIRFDDLSKDLKNKKTLKELKDAIEEFDKLDDSKTLNGEFNDDIDLLPSVRYSNYKLKKILVIIGMILLLILFSLVVYWGVNAFSNGLEEARIARAEEQRLLEEQRRREEEEKRKLKLYNECLVRTMTDADLTEDIIVAIDNFKTYLKDNYSVSVSYEDLTYGYTFSYNQDKVYYAASTIKALAALYIYQNASDGKINLDDTMVYSSKYKVSYSTGMKKHEIGSKISLRTLVKYSVIYSDNSAHQMLISYIGRSKLKEFGNSLGAKNTLLGGDNFGNTSSNDGLIYMKAVNEYIENNGELGKELKSYFVDSEQKELVVNNLVVANKYGLYKKYYHNMGIVYDESPYVVAIMTLEGNRDEEAIVKEISEKIYELHNLYKTNRVNVCQIEVYGNKKSTSS